MPKWLSRTLLGILLLVLIAGALVGAFYAGQKVGLLNAGSSSPSDFNPRQDRDQIKPTLRDDAMPFLPWFHMTDRTFMFSRLPVIGFILAVVWGLARLGLLVLLIWLIVRFVLRRDQPAPPVPPATPPQEPPATNITE